MEAILVMLILVGFAFVLAMGQRIPTISSISSDQIVDINGTVNLDCTVENGADFSVVWMKLDSSNPSDDLILSSGSSLITPDDRYSLRYNITKGNYTLQLEDAQRSDAGIYQCQVVIDISNRITADVSVLVRYPPMMTDNSTRSHIVSEGSSVVLECYADGFPLPRISWRRENNAILPTGDPVYRGNNLTISNISKEDRGIYYCVAENGVGNGVRHKVGVEVEFTPVVTTKKSRVGQALDYDADLECTVEAYPLPAIKWMKGDTVLADNAHYRITIFATSDEFMDANLRVVSIEENQYGQYSCIAQNKLGLHQTTVELFKTFDTVCPPVCHGLEGNYTADEFLVPESSTELTTSTDF